MKADLLLLAIFFIAGTTIAALGLQLKAMVFIVGIAAIILIYKKPEYGILLLLSVLLFSYPSILKGIKMLSLHKVLGILFFFLLVVHFARERDFWFLKCNQIQLMFGIGAVLLISSWFSPDLHDFFLIPPYRLTQLDRTEVVLLDYFGNFAFVIFMIHFIKTREHLKLVFYCLLLLIAITVVSAFINSTVQNDYRAAASFGIKMTESSNHLAFYCLVGLAILWYLRLEINSVIKKLALLGCSVLLLIVVFLSASRSALLSSLFFLCILLIETKIQPRKIIFTAAVAAFLGFLALKAIPQQHLDRMLAFTPHSSSLATGSNHYEAFTSSQTRLNVLEDGLQIYLDSNLLLGVGPGNFRWLRKVVKHSPKKLSTHNSYIWALLNGGLINLILFLLLYWVTWRDLHWMAAQSEFSKSPPPWMAKSLRTVLLLFLFFSLFAEIWLRTLPFLIIGATIILKRLYIQNLSLEGAKAYHARV